MKRKPTQFRGFRLPRIIDDSTKRAAATSGVSQSEIVIRILADAVRDGTLPPPPTELDRRQLLYI